MIKDLVSIITPCYNGEKYIENFLESVLQQSYEKIELIVINDGSEDRTADILEKYKDKFEKRGYIYRYYYQENRGQAAAINVGLKVYRGEYLMWVDSDDILLKENVRKKVGFLQSHPECGIVLCEAVVVNNTNLEKGIKIVRRRKPSGKDSFFEDLILEKNIIFPPAAIMTKRECVETVLSNNHIYESRQGQNWQLMLPLAYTYQCGYLEEVLFKIVVRKDSHSRMPRSYEQQLLRCDEFVVLLLETISNMKDMSDEEKKTWKIRIREKYDIRKLYLAYGFHKYQDAKKMKELLESYMGKKVWRYSYLNYVFVILKSGITNKIRKLCQKDVVLEE